MKVQINKAPESKIQPAANSRQSTFQLADNRPEAVVQRKLHNTVGNSPQVVQFSMDIARRNWKTVLQYATKQANLVEHAFLKAGYTAEETGKMIVQIADTLGHRKQVFAHGKGDSDSGMQGDTMERIEACVADLIEWASANPKPVSEKKSSGYSGKRDDSGDKKEKKDKKDKDDGTGGSKAFGTGHLASWITGISAWQSRKT